MGNLINLLHDAIIQLDRRGQWLLLAACLALIPVFAGTAGVAAQAGAYPEMAAGIAMLVGLAVVCMTVWLAMRGARAR
jgi:hypothetical protein